MKFEEVIPLLKESPKFAYMRFVHKDFGEVDECKMTSCGPLGRVLYSRKRRSFKEDRRRLLAKRSLALIKAEEEKDKESTSSEEASDGLEDELDSDDSASGIEPDSEDEALLQEKQPESNDESDDTKSKNDTSDGETDAARSEANGGAKKKRESSSEVKTVSALVDTPSKTVLCKQESTRHLAYGLLGMDVGDSSDEGGDEDVAYFVSMKLLVYLMHATCGSLTFSLPSR